MSLIAQGRGVFKFPLGGLGVLGRGALGYTFSEGKVFATFCLPTSSFTYTGPTSVRGVGSYCSSCRFTEQGCHRTIVLGAWLLQPFIHHSEGHGGWWPVIDLSRLNRFI